VALQLSLTYPRPLPYRQDEYVHTFISKDRWNDTRHHDADIIGALRHVIVEASYGLVPRCMVVLCSNESRICIYVVRRGFL